MTQVAYALMKQALAPWTRPTVPLVSSLRLIERDPFMTEAQEEDIQRILARAGVLANKERGLISTGDIVRATVGAGGGYLGGRMLGAILGLGSANKRRLQGVGALAGLLRNTGIWR